MVSKVLLPGEDDIINYPMIDHIMRLDIGSDETFVGAVGAVVNRADGSEAFVRMPLTNRAAMQLLHFLQRYAASQGLSPVDKPGPEKLPS